ncbi:MAG: cadherin-like beta sandwich domain-containing protein, partial [Actinomycetes bacterium]
SSDTSLVTFQVNGEDVEDDGSIELEAGTTEVGVTIETTDPDATYEISGENELVVGENTLNVTVTAADGVTTQEYFVTLVVLSGANTDLSVFTVNGSDVVDGDVVDIEPGVTDVEVVVETEDPDATVTYEGDSGLQPGENILVVTVTSADGENTAEYVVTLNVLLGIDTSLAVFQVDGNDVADGDVVDLEPGTTDVEVTVEATDLDATVEISGDSDLSTGENVLSVRVTAADGIATRDYFVILNVPASNNANITSFTINGSDVVDGETFEVTAGTNSVEVVVETEDADATYEVSGGTDLVIGENELTVTVTAADGETTAEYKVTIYVPSNDTAVTSIQVDGLETLEGDIVSVPSDATSAEVSVTTRDENAQVTVTGADELQAGDNTITVTVTAQDGTTRNYVFTIRVGGASADTALTSLTFNGVEVTPGATVNLPPRSTSVAVVAVTRDLAATVKVVGRTGLDVGDNYVTVTVTAPDLVNVRTFTIRVVVAPLSSNTNLSTFTVNGTPVQYQGVLQLAPLTRSVAVVAQTEDAEAVAVVAGSSGLIDGNNTLTVTVTAANGSKRVYTVTLNVRPLSTDTSLKTFTVNGLSAVNGVVTVEPVATSAVVVAEATDTRSSVVISGGTGLRVGDNALTVLVTAESGATKTYKVTIKVPASNNTSLKSIEVNGVAVEPSSKVTLPLGTTGAIVKAFTQDPQAKAVISGGSALVPGDNNLVVTVTAADGTTVKTYSVNLFVTRPSSDTTLKIFKINGVTVTDGGTIVVPALTTSVSVDAAANSAEAKVAVTGKSGLVDGPNKVEVTVTAGNGSSTTYSVTVTVIKLSNDTSLKTFTVNGADYKSQVIEVAFGTRSVDVVAIPTDSGAKAAVIGNGALRTGQNQVSVKVTAANGVTAEYVISVTVKKASNTDLTTLSVNNQSALNGETITLPAKTGQALVKVVTSDPEATFQVTGTTLQSGNNTVNVSVNAADGTNRQIEISVYVTPLSSNTALSSFKVNGEVVVDAGSVSVANRTVTVPVVAVASDAEALVAVSGNTGLKTGSNTVSVTVTAANGTKKVYTVTVVVAKSSNKELAVLTVNGQNALTGSSITLPARTSSAVVKAVTVDTDASVSVAGTTLSSGANTVTVTVTAADASTRQIEISVYVTPLSSNTAL